MDKFVLIAVLFVGALLLFHLAFVWSRNLSQLAWKYVDYLWICMALLGAIAASGDIDRHLTEIEIEKSARVSASLYNLFRELYLVNAPAYACVDVKNPGTADTQAPMYGEQFAKACDWFKVLAERFPRFTSNNYKKINFESLSPPQFESKVFASVIEDMRILVSKYNASINVLHEVQKSGRLSRFEKLYIALWPIFLILAVAIRITRVSGEIKNERARQQVPAGSEQDSVNS